MRPFIKLTYRTGGVLWVNSTKVIVVQSSGHQDANACLLVEGGQHVEVYHVTETIEEIMEILNGGVH